MSKMNLTNDEGSNKDKRDPGETLKRIYRPVERFFPDEYISSIDFEVARTFLLKMILHYPWKDIQ